MLRERTTPQVVVIEDQTFLRLGIVRRLSDAGGLEVAGQGGDGLEAERLCSMHRPDVVLLDISLPDTPCAATICRLRRRFPDLRVVLLIDAGQDRRVQEALEAGAVAWVAKDAPPSVLSATLERAPAPPKPEVIACAPSPAGVSRLTERETMVLRMLAADHTNQQIAHQLGIREKTVRNHVWHVYMKLGMASRGDASRYATGEGLLSA
jgi:DNA-binding NarL/FixJ family response regulator